MQYMIVERFHPGKGKILYQRFEEKGRMLPDGVHYLDSWISEDVSVCYQLMEADSIEGLKNWVRNWDDLADFEIVPVISSESAKEKAKQQG